MNPLILILGLFVVAQLSVDNKNIECPIVITTSPLIQQDSTPPNKKRSGVVKVKQLGAPKKTKKISKKEKSSTKKNRSKKTTTVNKAKEPKQKKEKVVKTPNPSSSKKTKKKKIVKSTPKSSATKNAVAKRSKSKVKGLTQEEEVKLLAKTKSIDAKNKIHPESQENCNFAFDVIDEFTGIQKRGLAARPFFSYTPDKYRKFIKEDDFIRCEGFLSQSSGGTMALNINFYVASREAKHKFGGIKPNSALVLHPMDGKEFFLMTYKGAKPQVVDNMTYYQCSFAINKSDLKNLRKAEIDQVKISFQKGFQTYDVFYLDFMIDQFPCFE